eukprot:2225494-Pyramimonas_sp.AAC.1
MAEAVRRKHLLPDEITPEVRARVRSDFIQNKKNREKYDKDKATMDRALRPPMSFRLPEGSHVFFDCELTISVHILARTLQNFKFNRVFERHRATIFVVDKVDTPNRKSLWACLLVGGTVCTLKHLLSGGREGPSLSYNRVLDKKKQVWASADFRAKHGEIYEILKLAVRGLP